jgi:WD40 repeat protein
MAISLKSLAAFGDETLLYVAQVRKFGDYELLAEIARGGMGVVYRAWQISADREVAVKMILAGQLATPESVARFRNEAAAAAKLDHPHIVPVYEIGEFEMQHFFSMRYVPGERNIAQWARALPVALRSEAVARAMSAVARAVAFAHERAVLHRDLKPSNILIDEAGEPQVTDFGLAKLLDDPDASVLTRSSAILGSPSYMAPEQAEPGGREVTRATDVYGLGAILYELLSGRPPFTGASPLIVARRVVEESPRRLLEAPEDLDTICRKCLAKDPRDRYASAADLAEDLERFARGQRIEAQRESTLSIVASWLRRHPGVAVLVTALLVALLGGFAGVLWQWRHAEAARVATLAANTRLRASVTQLEWRRVVQLLDSGDNSIGMAQLARFLRANPENPRAASLAISVLEQRGFATPVAPALSHGPAATVVQARLSADEKRIVTAGSDGTARLWDAATSEPLGAPMQHGGAVRWAEFSSDGKRVATASDDQTARVWDARTGAPLTAPLAHDGAVVMLKFSDAGLATISADGRARVWQGNELQRDLRLDAPGRALAWSSDGARLFTASAAGVKAWSAEGGELYSKDGAADGLALSPDGNRLLGWSDKGLRVWDAATGAEGVKLEEMSGLLHATWSPEGSRVAGAATGGWARIWDVATGRPITPRLEHLYRCSCVAFSPDGRTLLSGGADGVARRWDAATAASVAAPLTQRDAVMGAAYSASGTHLLVVAHAWGQNAAPRSGEVQLWDLRPRGSLPWRLRSTGTTSAAAWNSDGRFCATIAVGGSLCLHEVGGGDLIFPSSKIDGPVRGLALLPGDRHISVVTNGGEISVWSIESRTRSLGPLRVSRIETSRVFPDGQRLVTGQFSGEVKVWDLSTGAILAHLPKHRAPLNDVAVSPDGRFVASAGEDGRCIVSDAATGLPRFEPGQAGDEIVSVQFSPDGRWIVTAAHDRSARQWDASTGAARGPVLLHDGEVVYAEYSPDGARVLTADRAGAARIWDAATGAPLTEPLRHTTALRNAAFSPDGRRIVTEDHEGLRLWETATGEPLTLRQPLRIGLGIGYHTQGLHVLFSPDGESVLQGTNAREVLRWRFPAPPTPAPPWLADLLESIASLSVSDESALAPIPPAARFALREKLRTLPGDDFYARWAREYWGEPGP